MTRLVALFQGAYYMLTGVWPLVSMHSFEAVSGPKTDDWLVRTVAVLVLVVGLVLVAAGLKRQLGAPIWILAIGCAAGLATIDFVYAMQGVIWPIYMLDGVGQVLLILAWVVAGRADMRQRHS